MEQKKAYIQSKIKDLNPEFLASKYDLLDGTSVTFQEYCDKYLPSIMDNNFRLTESDFIETMDDLIMMQQFMTQINPKRTTAKEEVKEVITETNDKEAYITSIIQKYTEEELNYVIDLGSGGKLIKDYIIELQGQMDDTFHVTTIRSFYTTVEEEIKQAIIEGRENQVVAENLMNQVSLMQNQPMPFEFLEMCLGSIPDNIGSNHIFFQLGIKAIDTYIKDFSDPEEKQRMINTLNRVSCKNKGIQEYAEEKLFSLKMHNFIKDMLDELDDEPIAIMKARAEIERLINIYNTAEEKTVDFLQGIRNNIEVHRANIEVYFSSKIGGVTREDRNYLESITSIQDKIKNESVFHDEFEYLKRRYQAYRKEFELDCNPNYEEYYSAFQSLTRDLEELFSLARRREVEIPHIDYKVLESVENDMQSIARALQITADLKKFY